VGSVISAAMADVRRKQQHRYTNRWMVYSALARSSAQSRRPSAGHSVSRLGQGGSPPRVATGNRGSTQERSPFGSSADCGTQSPSRPTTAGAHLDDHRQPEDDTWRLHLDFGSLDVCQAAGAAPPAVHNLLAMLARLLL
jgi:hypothetical protein